MTTTDELRERLQAARQDHLLDLIENDGNEEEQNRWIEELSPIDFDQIAALFAQAGSVKSADSEPRAASAAGPKDVVRQPASPADQQSWDDAIDIGSALLGAGRVGAIVVAGGQGTRLGFDKPKGMFPIGPVSGATLFQILAEQVRARGEEAGHAIPYYVMTSDATHDRTVAFFRENHSFGLDPADVIFFRQGHMPAVDAKTGRLLLADRRRLVLGPDGHGGIFAALHRGGILDDMAKRGLEVLDYHQVDNPTAIVCDPAFLGWHASRVSEMSTKVVAKTSPSERMGVVCDIAGSTEIIEYSDLPAELAGKTDETGQPIFWAGNTAMHAINRTFLEQLGNHPDDLPFHIARKAVPYCDPTGTLVTPAEPNALKFERFIFDALPLAKRTMVIEADRAREFNPVKNAAGSDSPQTARQAIDRIGKTWLQAAGANIADDATIEISPLFALDQEELARKISEKTKFSGQVYLRD